MNPSSLCTDLRCFIFLTGEIEMITSISSQSISYIVSPLESWVYVCLPMPMGREESANDPYPNCQNDLRSINLFLNGEMAISTLSPDVLVSYRCCKKNCGIDNKHIFNKHKFTVLQFWRSAVLKSMYYQS